LNDDRFRQRGNFFHTKGVCVRAWVLVLQEVGSMERLVEQGQIAKKTARRMPGGVRKTYFWSVFIEKLIILPRQARDKHRENSKKRALFSVERSSSRSSKSGSKKKSSSETREKKKKKKDKDTESSAENSGGGGGGASAAPAAAPAAAAPAGAAAASATAAGDGGRWVHVPG
jgi:hypothetical protein